MQIHVDMARCVASGMCTATAPAVFDQDECDGTVRVLQHDPHESEHAAVREAVLFCPGRALRLDDAAGAAR